MKYILLLFALTLTAQAQASSTTAIQNALDLYAKHGTLDIPPPSKAVISALHNGEVIHIPTPSTRPDVAGGVLVMLLINQPRLKVWIANQDPHLAKTKQIDEFLVHTPRPHTYQWYGFVDFPFPFSDRHWVVESANNPQVATDTQNQIWERRWMLTKPALQDARKIIAADPNHDVALKDFDSAIFTPTNEGMWLFIRLSETETLLGYFVTSEIGGYVPVAAFNAWVRHTTSSMLQNNAKRALIVEEHYTQEHHIMYGGDNKVIPQW
jgi:hypothetical protein